MIALLLLVSSLNLLSMTTKIFRENSTWSGVCFCMIWALGFVYIFQVSIPKYIRNETQWTDNTKCW
ncbi:hypothetical protein U0070_025973 [Myodes glareolus]|uniref:Uncharacterized protein n=1 Tax=Myodes glareolus TaxID=447135 RepID=A0AAW0J2T1_MYOGA